MENTGITETQQEIIENLLIRFNFPMVYKVVHDFGCWQYGNAENKNPTMDELEETAREVLETAFRNFAKQNPSFCSCGGFEAEVYKRAGIQEATLKFILTEFVEGNYDNL